MKTDFYTKTVLTLIAICLCILVLKDIEMIPKAYATAPKDEIGTKIGSNKAHYALVPVNADGTMDVNIVGIDTYDEMEVSIGNTVDVNIDEVGGYSTFGAVPVEME